MSEKWFDDEDAVEFFVQLKRRRMATLENLLGIASKSSDPAVRQVSGALSEIDQVLFNLEDERRAKRNSDD